MGPAITIEPVTTLEDYAECLRLQRLTWGEGFAEAVPASIFAFLRRISGVIVGAWTSEPRTLVGFGISFPGIWNGTWVQWSDMVAVRSDHRDAGIGHRLKRAQREEALAKGFGRMLWTFDPLESRNAWLNFAKLGATSSRYEVDFYGAVECALLRDLPTDRLVVEWDLTRALPGDPLRDGRVPASPSRDPLRDGRVPPADPLRDDRAPASPSGDPLQPDRVPSAPAGDPPGAGPPVVLERAAESGVEPALAGPRRPILGLDADELLLEIPGDLQALKAHDITRALAWRHATREAFTHYLGRGYHVAGFERIPGEAPRSFYRLSGPGTP